jgi:hypothetical protein
MKILPRRDKYMFRPERCHMRRKTIQTTDDNKTQTTTCHHRTTHHHWTTRHRMDSIEGFENLNLGEINSMMMAVTG